MEKGPRIIWTILNLGKKLTFDDSNLDRIWEKFEMQTFPKRFVPHKNFE